MLVDHTAVYIFVFLMIVAAIGDIRYLRIPNALILIILCSFFSVAVLEGMPWHVIGLNTVAAISSLLVGFALFHLGAFGGGDAKLLAVTTLWLGWPALPTFLVWTSLSGGALAALVIIRSIASNPSTREAEDWRRLPVPYGVALAFGAVLALPNSWWMGRP